MTAHFRDFDLTGFWKASEYATKKYVEPPPSEGLVARVEQSLGYKLPKAYVELAAIQNGGIPNKTRHRTSTPTSWAADHVALSAIFAIGESKDWSLAGPFGNAFWPAEWGYPKIGVYFAGCPSAGHDLLCLDYRTCGPTGEPLVVHVDQDQRYRITELAPNFEAFIRGLQAEEDFPLEP